MNKQINLGINDEGGVGKSFFAVNFLQYLKDCGVAHGAIDSAPENLRRMHKDRVHCAGVVLVETQSKREAALTRKDPTFRQNTQLHGVARILPHLHRLDISRDTFLDPWS